MDPARAIDTSRRHERERLRFLEAHRGVDQARDFARRTRAIYRRCVVGRTPPAGDTVIRLRLIGSYCEFKRYLAGAQDARVR